MGKGKRSAAKITVLVLCGVLAAALLTLLGLIFRQAAGNGDASAASSNVYTGPVLPDAAFRSVLLTDSDLNGENGAAQVLEYLRCLGADAVVFDGTEENLSALLAASQEDSPAVYCLVRLLEDSVDPDYETVGGISSELREFVLRNGGLSGVVFTDYTIRDTDALRERFTDECTSEGFEEFVVRTESYLLARAQQTVTLALKDARTGAVVSADRLCEAALRSIHNDFLLLDAGLGGKSVSPETVLAWTRYSGTEEPVCVFYTQPLSRQELETSQTEMTAAGAGSGGYLLTGFPTEQPEGTGGPSETETVSSGTDAESSDGSEGQPRNPQDGASSDETESLSEETIPPAPGTDGSTPDASSAADGGSSGRAASSPESPEPSASETPDGSSGETELLSEAHERTLRLLAGLTDPADMEPFYLPDDLLSDKLILNRPLSKSASGSASSLLFTGIVPLGSTVTLDGEPVELDAYGHFHYDVPLYVGANIIYLKVDDETHTFYYTRNVIDVLNYSPVYSATVDGGGEVPVWITARSGAEITAELGDTVVRLVPQDNSYFPTYTGSIPLPEGGAEPRTLGNVIFRVTVGGKTQVVTGGAISLNGTGLILPERVIVSSQDSKYKDDGCAAVYPVFPCGAHAPDLPDFDAAADSNWNYSPLPDGTVDAVTGRAVYSGVEYYTLASGVRIAAEDVQPTDLPCTDNRIRSLTMLNDRTFTHLVLDMTCPVFFQVDYGPEEIRVSFSGTVSVPADMPLGKTPLFTAARWEGTTLVLPLRVREGFPGYTARYVGSRLILSCTNPPASGSVEGARIVVDPGHGGFDGEQSDPGAVGAGMLDEAQFNYYIGCYLAEYLIELGADPVVTPSNTEYLTIAQRLDYASAHRASMNISIHHNASTSGSSCGVGTYYYQDASEPLAALVQREVSALHTALVDNGADHDNGLYHTRYMFTLRTGWTSLMLEDGFVCSGPTYTRLVEPEFQASVAKAIAAAITEYYERHDAVAGWPTGIERSEAVSGGK